MWRRRYYKPDDPASYGGLQRLVRATGVKPKKAANWLASQDTYTLHKPVQRRFQRLTTNAVGLNHYWQADLLDLSKLHVFNDGYRFLLNVVDVFSRFGWSVPLKNKTGGEVARGLRTILTVQNSPIHLQTDQGTEFYNTAVRKLLKQYDVNHFSSKSQLKAAIVERWNRTLRERIWRYFSKHNVSRYIDGLSAIVKGYNATPHTHHGHPPDSITLQNENIIYKPRKKCDIEPKFKVGDTVRVSTLKLPFAKGATNNWTYEIFTVQTILPRSPVVYKLTDSSGEPIIGVFYSEELQKIIIPRSKRFPVEKVIARDPQKGVLVKWLHYPNPTWIPETWIST